jgi:GalNAc-alpha-(1->4)-GalNAc-alpha-(1->3)-diNAcBac-PP-undecaprenol alpha-1,4-N-acetyl-D-galactosaminyltransferase
MTNQKIELIFFLPNFGSGGAGKSITELCEKIDKKKFNITIICLNKCFYKNRLLKFCKKIYELDVNKTFYAQILIYKILRKDFKDFKKVIFISNLYYCNALTLLVQKKLKNVIYIMTERTPFEELSIYFGFLDFIKKKIIKLILKLFYYKADLIITNSKKTRNDIRLFSGSRVISIYPSSYKKNIVKSSLARRDKKKIILSIGRLSKEKGYDILIRSIPYINYDNFLIKIVGEGPEKNNLINLSKKLGVNNKIIFLGNKKENIISRYYSESNLFISPSYFEGFPNVVVEALSFNLPVICSDSYGGIKEILLDNKGGYIFKNSDFRDLADKINLFFEDPDQFINKTKFIKKHICKFSLKNTVNNYEKVFLNI